MIRGNIIKYQLKDPISRQVIHKKAQCQRKNGQPLNPLKGLNSGAVGLKPYRWKVERINKNETPVLPVILHVNQSQAPFND